jgi:hypothetical protein
MDQKDTTEVKRIVEDSLKSFSKRIGDTPTDAFQLVPKKYVDPRVVSITSSQNYIVNTDIYNHLSITALSEDITITTSGSPTNFARLIIRIKDNGTSRAITWGSMFSSYGVTLPSVTVISKVLTVGFLYDSIATKWGCVAVVQE